MAESTLPITPGSGANVATHTISVGPTEAHISRTVINDANGDDIVPAKDSTLTDGSQKAQVTALPALAAGSAIIGQVLPAVKADNAYHLAALITPSTLTDGTYFFAMRNPSEAVRVLIKRIWITPSFIGTPASSRSVYVLQRASGAFTGTGGSTLTPVKRLTSAADSVVVEARAGGALTMSSITPASTQFIFGHLNQLLEPPVTLLDLQNTPIVLAANEGLTLRASGAIVSGSSVMLHIEWAEVAA